MAGAYLTIGAKFRPFSYAELIQPIARMEEKHAAIESQYGELMQKAGVWENLANKETDPETYAKYKQFSDDLKTRADDLAKNGLNSQSVRSLMDMRARYSNDIVPIEQAYTRRRQLSDEQRKLYQTNPTLKFQRDMSTTSLDDFVNNPELDYGYTANGALIAQQATQAFSHLAKTITSEPQYKQILGGQYWQSKIQSGMTPEEVLAYARDDADAPAQLRAISKQVYDSTGVEEFIKNNYSDTNSPQAQEWRDYINSYIKQGAWSAIGTQAYGNLANKQWDLNAQLAALRTKAGLSGKSGSGAAAGTTTRSDTRLIGKADENNKHYLGRMNLGDNGASKEIVKNTLGALYDKMKELKTVEGYDKDGKLRGGTMSKKEFYRRLDDKSLNFTDVQVDYDSGNLIAIAEIQDGKRTRTERFLLPYNTVLDTENASGVQNAVEKYNQIEAAKEDMSPILTAQQQDGIWYITSRDTDGQLHTWREDEYKEYLKNQIYNCALSMFNYVGALNTNVEAGQKMAASRSPYGASVAPEVDMD